MTNKTVEVTTERQEEVVSCISRFWKDNGYSPSVRDLSDMMGGISTNAVAGHLEALERKGRIKRAKGVARSLVVLG